MPSALPKRRNPHALRHDSLGIYGELLDVANPVPRSPRACRVTLPTQLSGIVSIFTFFHDP